MHVQVVLTTRQAAGACSLQDQLLLQMVTTLVCTAIDFLTKHMQWWWHGCKQTCVLTPLLSAVLLVPALLPYLLCYPPACLPCLPWMMRMSRAELSEAAWRSRARW